MSSGHTYYDTNFFAELCAVYFYIITLVANLSIGGSRVGVRTPPPAQVGEI